MVGWVDEGTGDAGQLRPATTGPRHTHWLGRRLLDIAWLMRLHRPIGIWLLLWPTVWALWIAGDGHPPPRLILLFLAGTVLMRSAGCVVNDLADMDIDPHVRRTRDRPLAARRVSPREAVALFLLLVSLALVVVLQLNALCVKLSLAGAALTVTYPLLKRFFPIPQLYLGLAFGWGVPMAFAAQLGLVPRVGWVMLLAAVLWAGVYDSFYAMADRPDDLKVGVKSSAITFGDLDLVMIGAMQLMMLMALYFTGRLLIFGAPWRAGLAVAAVMFAVQLWRARTRAALDCLWAFNNNNAVGLVLLAGLIVDYSSGH
jgi:4-hydroxybenzoate polyprenyltransferase